MKKLGLILATCASLLTMKAAADDIEIYLGGAATGGEPYVHLMLDYRPSVFSTLCTYGTDCLPPFMSAEAYANLGAHASGDKITRFDVFVAVMATIFDNPLFEGINMALVISNFDNGGTILEGYKLLKDHKAELISTLKAIPVPKGNSSVHKLQPSEAYYEWYRYINGGQVIHGKSTSNNFDKTDSPSYDTSIISGNGTGNSYISPFDDLNECSKLFSIAIAMNAANQDDSLDSEIKADMSSSAAKKFEDMMKYMHATTSDLVGGINGVQPLQKSWVISDAGSVGATRDWSAAGGSGSPLDIDDPVQLEEDLVNAFKEVISVSSTFVAASVPVNVFNQTKALDNLFVALFEAQSTLRWPGNIKKLRLVDDPNTPTTDFDAIVDVNGDPGFETTGANKGRIAFDAQTFWTNVAALPAPGPDDEFPANVDGREVARGGAGQKINGFITGGSTIIGDANSETGARRMHVEPSTFTNGSANAFDPFNADAATATSLRGDLGAATDADALELIRWGRGQDIDDEDGDGSFTDPRAWLLGDTIHSRPFALNYGALAGFTRANPYIRLMFGTGDGSFHIIQNTTTGSAEDGSEVFAFYPRELLSNLALRRANTESSLKMRYGVDGAPVVLTRDINRDGTLDVGVGDEAYVYFGLRRGGSSYYALDVSDPTSTPTLKWKITQTTGGDFDELGLSFSTPIVGKVRFDGTNTDVLIFAGGYNGGWNSAYTSRVGKDANDADDSIGNAIYIVNARTGALIWKAVKGNGTSDNTHYYHPDLVDSIPSSVTALRNAGGTIHRLYVGDTGGAVWRVDLPAGSAANHRKDKWFITKLAELGTDGVTTDRRFFHEPDVVETLDSTGNYDGVLISSGDRAHPNETSVLNYHFYIKDRLIASGDAAVKSRTPLTLADLADQSGCGTGTEVSCGTESDLASGWRVALARPGEKGLATGLIDGGRAFMTSFKPASGVASCAPSEGTGSLYVVDLKDGSNQVIYELGPGIPPNVILIGNVLFPPSRPELDPNSPSDPNEPGPCEGAFCESKTQRLVPIYWREPGIDKL